MITEISFFEIYGIWRYYLWSDRISTIETNSAMNFLGGYDSANMSYTPHFFAYIVDSQIVGVNSGHHCSDNSYRSRGLYVLENYRRQGIGVKLLKHTIEQGRKEFCDYVWSYPKQSSWTAYKNAGFTLASDWHQSELDINAYCKIDL